MITIWYCDILGYIFLQWKQINENPLCCDSTSCLLNYFKRWTRPRPRAPWNTWDVQHEHNKQNKPRIEIVKDRDRIATAGVWKDGPGAKMWKKWGVHSFWPLIERQSSNYFYFKRRLATRRTALCGDTRSSIDRSAVDGKSSWYKNEWALQLSIDISTRNFKNLFLGLELY